MFTAIGLGLVLVQAGLVHPVAGRLGEVGTVRFGLAANGLGLLLLAADGGWVTLVPALALLVRRPGPVTPTHVVGGRRRVARPSGGARRSGCSSRPAASPGWSARRGGVLFGHVGVAVPYLVGAALVVAGGRPRARRRAARVGSRRIDVLAWLPPGNMRLVPPLRTTRGSDG